MSNGARAALSMSAASMKRSKTVGGLAIILGLFAAVVALVNVLGGHRDMVDMLLLVGGLMLSITGFSLLRRLRVG